MGISSIIFSAAYPACAAAKNNSSAPITVSKVKAALEGVERYLRSKKAKLDDYHYNKFWDKIDKLWKDLEFCTGYSDKEVERQCIENNNIITRANDIVINIGAEVRSRARASFIESLEGKRTVGDHVEITRHDSSKDNQFGNELAKFKIEVFGRDDDTITPTCTKYIIHEMTYNNNTESWSIVRTKRGHGDCPEEKATKKSGGMFKGLFK